MPNPAILRLGGKEMLRTKTIDEFVKTLASDAPTPGGGSVAALNGALGCSLLLMVCNLTLGKEKYKDAWPDLESLRTELEELLEELTDSIDRDAAAYDTFTAARKLPKSTDEEKKARREAMQTAMKTAAETPKATARYIHQALKMAKDIAEKGNPNVLSDAGTGVSCLLSGLYGAILNIGINLGGIKDEAYTHQMKIEMNFLWNEGEKLAEDVMEYTNRELGINAD